MRNPPSPPEHPPVGSTQDFYDALAPFYHLIFPDWEASVARQGAELDAVIRSELDGGARTVLDAACGIGTQSLGLAALGYDVTASDLSAAAVSRLREEAARRGLAVDARTADMRDLWDAHGRAFDVVLCADNSLPHLLTDGDILQALREFHRCTRPDGLCLVSLRDYESIDSIAAAASARRARGGRSAPGAVPGVGCAAAAVRDHPVRGRGPRRRRGRNAGDARHVLRRVRPAPDGADAAGGLRPGATDATAPSTSRWSPAAGQPTDTGIGITRT